MHKVVLGAVDTRAQAELAVRRLEAIGVPASISSRRGPGTDGSSAAFGAIAGIALGVLVGVGVVAVPAVRALVAAGPVLAALAAAAAIGLVLAIAFGLFGLAVPERRREGRERYVVRAVVRRRRDVALGRAMVREIAQDTGGAQRIGTFAC